MPFFYRISLLFCLLATELFFSGCSKFVEVPVPSTLLTSAQVFADDEGAREAASGVYATIANNNLGASNGGITLYAGLSADELQTVVPSADLDMFFTNSISPDNAVGLSRLWSVPYKIIYQANAVLEGLRDSHSHVSDTLRRRLEGEMLVVRAFHFFYLANLFGPVPLTLTTDYRVNRSLPRASLSAVYDQLLNDLRQASVMLPGDAINERSVPNRYAAFALLARVYFYRGAWQAALQAADSVIQSGYYQLENDITRVFSSASREAIWRLPPPDGGASEAFFFEPPSASVKPPVEITVSLRQVFSAQDKRIAAWMGVQQGSRVVYYPAKYKRQAGAGGYVFCRAAELQLVVAECRMRLHDLPGACTALNGVRMRAGLLPVSTSDEPTLLQLILEERQRELFAEWGHRWLDLKRLALADAVLGPVKGLQWQSTDQLYPILGIDVIRNSSLVQNPGY